jgi:hypothetical protein
VVIGFILFMLLGFGFGFAIRGPAAWIALAVPVVFALLTAAVQGIDGRLLLVLVVALVLTALSIIGGRALDRYLERRQSAQA